MVEVSKQGELVREISPADFALANARSPTAASAQNPLYKPSGAMDYRVLLAAGGGARQSTVVNAVSGDEAAAKAGMQFPGMKVAHVGPVAGDGRITDDLAGE